MSLRAYVNAYGQSAQDLFFATPERNSGLTHLASSAALRQAEFQECRQTCKNASFGTRRVRLYQALLGFLCAADVKRLPQKIADVSRFLQKHKTVILAKGTVQKPIGADQNWVAWPTSWSLVTNPVGVQALYGGKRIFAQCWQTHHEWWVTPLQVGFWRIPKAGIQYHTVPYKGPLP
jgi:hypothetical protein